MVAAGLGVGCEAAGFERLKAEKSPRSLGAGTGVGAGGFCCGAGAGAGAEGSAKSNRSMEALGAAGFEGAGGALAAKLKSPKSFEELGVKFACGFWTGFDPIEGIDGCFGPASKNPPPLKGDVICGGAADDR